MHKTRSLVTYNLMSWGAFLKWLLIWLIGFNLLFVVIGLLTHGFSIEGATGGWGALGVQLLRTIEGIAILGTFAYALVPQYSEFKVAIHGGVSRVTMWRAHMLTLIIAIVASWLLWVLTNACASALDHIKMNPSWHSLVGIAFFAISFNAFGALFALFNRRGKIILACALVTGGIALIMLIVRLMISTQDFWTEVFTGFGHLGTTGQLTILWIIYAIWLLVMLWVSYFCSKHLQLRRD